MNTSRGSLTFFFFLTGRFETDDNFSSASSTYCTYYSDVNWTILTSNNSTILDRRWESFPIVPEIVLHQQSEVYFSVQGSLLEIEFCFEGVKFCDNFEVEILRPGKIWNHYSIKLDSESLSLRESLTNRNIGIERNPEFNEGRHSVTKSYIKFGMIVRNLNVKMLSDWSERKAFIKKIKAKYGMLKLHTCKCCVSLYI